RMPDEGGLVLHVFWQNGAVVQDVEMRVALVERFERPDFREVAAARRNNRDFHINLILPAPGQQTAATCCRAVRSSYNSINDPVIAASEYRCRANRFASAATCARSAGSLSKRCKAAASGATPQLVTNPARCAATSGATPI